ncbi:hypothetical protein [Streptomyces sp. NPDC006510]|uniref:hypothetical protein n=1 Tax=Streptomyces sp. NPDC006510 TaxID=3155600 RepID=UPI0033BF8902
MHRSEGAQGRSALASPHSGGVAVPIDAHGRSTEGHGLFLLEGHAYWADQQITTKLLGEPVPTGGISPHATLRYRALAETHQRAKTLKYLNAAAAQIARTEPGRR